MRQLLLPAAILLASVVLITGAGTFLGSAM